ncbi:uncharacterized protein B0H18DRAFT_1117618 [Fomitopsis serialis]|uniref:uncharacterized protein n=1 Tax=Fomitopsis serialis TaxID=139415 RepID=UPI0020075AED|nr:uncharacterized protein B0H18DRAFT_1117618 [Neoantrodia serialis]KAH9929277.1 hypothetical protein B0H18DRAFT_1117618 [Neoantrodia serialis]
MPTGESGHAHLEATASQQVLSSQTGHEYGSESEDSRAVAGTARASSGMEVADSVGPREVREERAEGTRTSGHRSMGGFTRRSARLTAIACNHVAEGTASDSQDRGRADADWADVWLGERGTQHRGNRGDQRTEDRSEKTDSRTVSSASIERTRWSFEVMPGRRERGETEESTESTRREAGVIYHPDVQRQGADQTSAHRWTAHIKDENGHARRVGTTDSSIYISELPETRFRILEDKRGEVGEKIDRYSWLNKNLGVTTPGVAELWSGWVVSGTVASRVMGVVRVFWRLSIVIGICVVGCSVGPTAAWRSAARYEAWGPENGRTEASEYQSLRRTEVSGVTSDVEDRTRATENERIDQARRRRKKGDRRLCVGVEPEVVAEGSVGLPGGEDNEWRGLGPIKGDAESVHRDTECGDAVGTMVLRVKPGIPSACDEARSGESRMQRAGIHAKNGYVRRRVAVVDPHIGVDSNQSQDHGDSTNKAQVSEGGWSGSVLSEAASGGELGDDFDADASAHELQLEGLEPWDDQAESEEEDHLHQDGEPATSLDEGRAGTVVGRSDGDERHLPSGRGTSGRVEADVEATGRDVSGYASRDIVRQRDEVERRAEDGLRKEREQGRDDSEDVARGNAYEGSVQCWGASLELSTGVMTRERIDHCDILPSRGLANSGTSLQRQREEGQIGQESDRPWEPLIADGLARAHGEMDQGASLLPSNGEAELADEHAERSETREVVRPRDRVQKPGESGRVEWERMAEYTQDGDCVALVEVDELTGARMDRIDVPLDRSAADELTQTQEDTDQAAIFRAAESQGAAEPSARISGESGRVGRERKGKCAHDGDGATVLQVNSFGTKVAEGLVGSPDTPRGRHVTVARDDAQAIAESDGQELGPQAGFVEAGEGHVRAHGDVNQLASFQLSSGEPELADEHARQSETREPTRRRDRARTVPREPGENERAKCEGMGRRAQDGNFEAVSEVNLVEISQHQSGSLLGRADVPWQQCSSRSWGHAGSKTYQGTSAEPNMEERADERTGRGETWRGMRRIAAVEGSPSGPKDAMHSRRERTSRYGVEGEHDVALQTGLVEISQETVLLADSANVPWRGHATGRLGHTGSEISEGASSKPRKGDQGCGREAADRELNAPVELWLGRQGSADAGGLNVGVGTLKPESSASEDGPVEPETWLLGDFGEFDGEEPTPEDDLVACWHIAEDGRRLWGYIPRIEAEAALREVEQADKWIPEDGIRTVDEDTERSKWLAQYLVHERVQLRGAISDRQSDEQLTLRERGSVADLGDLSARSPANRDRPQSKEPSRGDPRRGAGPGGQPEPGSATDAGEPGFGGCLLVQVVELNIPEGVRNDKLSVGVIDAEERGRQDSECLLVESTELSIPEEEQDNELVSCCHLDDCGQWIIESLPRDKAKKAVAEADQRLRGGFVRRLETARGHTMRSPAERERPSSMDPSMGEVQREAGPGGQLGTAIDAEGSGLFGDCLLLESAKPNVPEEACNNELVRCGHLDENGHWIFKYLPYATEVIAETNRDCGWVDRDEHRTRGFGATRGRGVEDDRADGLASFMSQWIALG